MMSGTKVLRIQIDATVWQPSETRPRSSSAGPKRIAQGEKKSQKNKKRGPEGDIQVI